MPHLILASSSPRRRELLETLGLRFSIEASDVDETFADGMQPADVVKELAVRKATAVARRIRAGNYETSNHDGHPGDSASTERDVHHTLVLAADTIVVHNGLILGKPRDKAEAIETLTTLQGKTHEVFTGVCLMDVSGTHCDAVTECTRVTMGTLPREDIVRYVDTGDPMDKAGSYGIQGPGAVLIERIEGDYFTVVGLPVRHVAMMLRRQGLDVMESMQLR